MLFQLRSPAGREPIVFKAAFVEARVGSMYFP